MWGPLPLQKLSFCPSFCHPTPPHPCPRLPQADCYVASQQPPAHKHASGRPAATSSAPIAAAHLGDGYAGEEDEGEEGEGGLLSALALPEDLSSIDPAVLSTLPTSLQLDILEKMRDAQIAGGWYAGGVCREQGVCVCLG